MTFVPAPRLVVHNEPLKVEISHTTKQIRVEANRPVTVLELYRELQRKLYR